MINLKLRYFFGLFCTLVFCLACSQTKINNNIPTIAEVFPTSGEKVSGDVFFKQTENGVEITFDLKNLAANSKHGVHIHENGNCAGPNAKMAGGHFSLKGQDHGNIREHNSHLGDLGNLQANSSGEIKETLKLSKLSLNPQSKRSILGRSIIIHNRPDDLSSSPSGKSGKRIGCGVIGVDETQVYSE